MPRFVILHHVTPPRYARPTHFDWMFEAAQGLRTWALIAEPVGGIPQEGEILPDHRLDYLEFEGELSEGRGHVTRWDRGEFLLLEETEGLWRLRLNGERLQGELRLERSPHDLQRWLATFSPS